MVATPIEAGTPRSRDGRTAIRRLGVAIAIVAAALRLSVACGAADTASTGTNSCVPKICLAKDCIPRPPDGTSLCPSGKCNYQTQTGCPAGATCAAQPNTMTDTVGPECVQSGPRDRGEPCDNDNAPAHLCKPGFQCIHTAGAAGTCRKLCCGEEGASYGDWTACDPGESCIREIVASFESPPNSNNFVKVDAHVFACVPVNNCDVLDAKSCEADKERPVCRIADPLGNVACMPPGDANLGEPCAHLNQCGPVQICAQTVDSHGVPLTGPLTCRRLCRMGLCGEASCPEKEGTCVHFNRDPVGVGECTPQWDTRTCPIVDASGIPESDAGPNFCAGGDGG